MAKWGEGDPRWIVEERADAKNVNNWHWSDKDATNWSINTFKSLLEGLTFADGRYSCNIIGMPKCTGEAVANVRKCKLIYIYEWQIELEWECTTKNSDGTKPTTYKGKIEILKFSDEYSIDELSVLASFSSSDAESEMTKFISSACLEPIKSKAREYLKLLEDYSQDLILPTNVDKKNGAGITGAQKEVNKQFNQSYRDDTAKDFSNESFTVGEEFFCAPADLYNVLTNQQLVETFTRSSCVVDATPNGAYSIFNGNVSGTFDSLVPEKLIQMKWRKRDWPTDHHSLLKIEFTPSEKGTTISLNQTGVPAYDLENTQNGWRTIIFPAIKQTFGYDRRLF